MINVYGLMAWVCVLVLKSTCSNSIILYFSILLTLVHYILGFFYGFKYLIQIYESQQAIRSYVILTFLLCIAYYSNISLFVVFGPHYALSEAYSLNYSSNKKIFLFVIHFIFYIITLYFHLFSIFDFILYHSLFWCFQAFFRSTKKSFFVMQHFILIVLFYGVYVLEHRIFSFEFLSFFGIAHIILSLFTSTSNPEQWLKIIGLKQKTRA